MAIEFNKSGTLVFKGFIPNWESKWLKPDAHRLVLKTARRSLALDEIHEKRAS